MSTPIPPKCPQRPGKLNHYGRQIDDPYHWLADANDSEVLDHLKAENSFSKVYLENLGNLREDLFQEFKSRVRDVDRSVPYKYGKHWYYHKLEAGAEYAVYFRADDENGTGEQLLFDGPKEAKGSDFFDVGFVEQSPDGALLAVAIDRSGDESYTIEVREFATGQVLTSIDGCGYSFAWYSDNKHFMYSVLDEQHRPTLIRRHKIGDDPKTDADVYREKDPRYFLDVDRSRSGDFLFLGSHGNNSSEVYVLPAKDPQSKPVCVTKRVDDVEYSVDHNSAYFYMLTNADGAANFKVMRANKESVLQGRADWEEYIPVSQDILLIDLDCFRDFFIVWEQAEANQRIRILDPRTGLSRLLEMEDDAFHMSGSTNEDYETGVFRFRFSTLTKAPSCFEYHIAKQQLTIKKEEVPESYDHQNYRTERIWVEARDGTSVPCTIAYRSDKGSDRGPHPLYLYSYGSYGHSMPASFSSGLVSLMDRGIVVARAHIRGGQDMGRAWYEDGKLMKKKNTFFDFIDVAKELCSLGWTNPEKLAIAGGSAGGMLVGTCMNMEPELFSCVVADVPFVDVINTMCNPDLPLTTMEYNEWGNPENAEAYEYIKSYSPYDNVRKGQRYPDLFVTAGLHDQRVTYWEPAKWVAKLREFADPKTEIYLDTKMSAGHAGVSGRYQYLREMADGYAFVIDRLTKRRTKES